VRLLAAAAWLLLAAPGPESMVLPGFRLHLDVSPEVEADRLEAVAQPGVVLWLRTTSNLVKRSVGERLGRAEASYVQLRPPLGTGVRDQFGPRVHPWVALEGLDTAAFRRWAPAGTAVEVMGALSAERVTAAQALRPQAVRWQPDAEPTQDEWARTAGLSGLEVRPSGPLPGCQRPLKGAGRIRLRVPLPQAESSASGCGFALRLEVPVSISEAELKDVLVRFPGAELWARVGSDADAAAAAALVGLLTAAVPAVRSTSPPGSR
jgi:hypothetical protein